MYRSALLKDFLEFLLKMQIYILEYGTCDSMKFNSISGVCVYVHERERDRERERENEYLELSMENEYSTVESIHLCISTLEC